VGADFVASSIAAAAAICLQEAAGDLPKRQLAPPAVSISLR
jgi:hypothetical protein